jgi:hypothetical protein
VLRDQLSTDRCGLRSASPASSGDEKLSVPRVAARRFQFSMDERLTEPRPEVLSDPRAVLSWANAQVLKASIPLIRSVARIALGVVFADEIEDRGGRGFLGAPPDGNIVETPPRVFGHDQPTGLTAGPSITSCLGDYQAKR